MLKKVFIFILFFGGYTCLAVKLKPGTYRATLLLNAENNVELPFNFDVKYNGKKPIIIIKNADERISVEEIIIKGDSVNFKMPVFDTEFRTVLKGDTLVGVWINHYRKEKNVIPFKAVYNQTNRFNLAPGKANPYFEGNWEVTFSPGTNDSSKAIGVFHHLEQTDFLTATFLTETGDYRYLEGMKHGNKLYLSCFDGSHAFLFIAKHTESQFKGKFYSGSHWEENWVATQNQNFKLRNADEITFLKNKDDKLNFSFPNLNKKIISINDKKYENKPLIIQVMGSWCPNCMDESAYLSQIYKQYSKQGIEIIALAFEKTTDFEKSVKQVTRLKDKFKIDYEILITGQMGKDKASETFSALNKISAFPTTLFLNKQHQVVKINTGFSGPATGIKYEELKAEMESQIKLLLKE